jgi:hypothetical protein
MRDRWERPQLRNIITHHQDIAWKHNVQLSTLRRVSEIIDKEDELFNRLWYIRSPPIGDEKWDTIKEDVRNGAYEHMREVAEKIGKDVLSADAASLQNWGRLEGSVAAIRWVLGDDWGNYDS